MICLENMIWRHQVPSLQISSHKVIPTLSPPCRDVREKEVSSNIFTVDFYRLKSLFYLCQSLGLL